MPWFRILKSTWLGPLVAGCAALVVAGCAVPLDADGDGIAAELGDCDDADAQVHPDAPDLCDGRDDDCDGVADEDGDPAWYPDADGDGFGIDATPVGGCARPDGYAAQTGDCDDTSSARNPAAAEACDGLDNNCDSRIDEDADGDGIPPCPAGQSPGDCDELRADTYPGALEPWADGVDNDCDGIVDADLYVSQDGDGPDAFGTPYPSIQAAIDAAADGEVVLVAAGTWLENLTFSGRTVTVVSESGPELTVIDAHQAGSAAVFLGGEPAPSTLKGFSLTGGTGTDPTVCGNGLTPSDEPNGGGICLRNASPKLVDLIVFGNNAFDGGGIHMSASAPQLERIELYDNTAFDDGGGIYLYASAPVIRGLSMHDNLAEGYGGGLGLYNSSPKDARDITLVGNAAHYGAGLSISFNSLPVLDRLTIRDNEAAEDGGGVYVGEGSVPTLRNSVIDDNRALGTLARGGGVVLDASGALLQNLAIRGNQSANRGGGLSFHWDSAPTLENVVIAGNRAVEGGGIFVYNSTPVLYHVVLAGNRADTNGGGVYNYFSSVSVSDSVFAWNEAVVSGWNLYSNDGSSGSSFASNAFWTSSGTQGIAGMSVGSSNLTVDPRFVALPEEDDRTGGDYRLQAGSPAIDAGTDGTDNRDPDATRGDMGAYGGPRAGDWDLDGDGAGPDWKAYDEEAGGDCDDEDPALTPAAGCG